MGPGMGQSYDFENILMKNPNRSNRGLDYAFFPENQIPNCVNRGIGIILLLQIFGHFLINLVTVIHAYTVAPIHRPVVSEGAGGMCPQF